MLDMYIYADDRSQMEHAATKSAHASLQVPQYVLEDALEKSGPRAAQCFAGENPILNFGQI